MLVLNYLDLTQYVVYIGKVMCDVDRSTDPVFTKQTC